MKVETIEEARALVGRTFERDGERREVVLVNFQGHAAPEPFDIVYVNPKRPNVFRSGYCHPFNRWLQDATEVTDVHDA